MQSINQVQEFWDKCSFSYFNIKLIFGTLKLLIWKQIANSLQFSHCEFPQNWTRNFFLVKSMPKINFTLNHEKLHAKLMPFSKFAFKKDSTGVKWD